MVVFRNSASRLFISQDKLLRILHTCGITFISNICSHLKCIFIYICICNMYLYLYILVFVYFFNVFVLILKCICMYFEMNLNTFLNIFSYIYILFEIGRSYLFKILSNLLLSFPSFCVFWRFQHRAPDVALLNH